jgi:hypothetical protein
MAAASAQPHVFDMTADEALAMSATIKPGVTNFSHFYMPENLDGSNGVYDLPDGTELYAFGDVHGDYDLVVNLLTKVAKVAVQNPDGTFSWSRPNCWVVLVGDMVDRFRIGHTLFEPIIVHDPVAVRDIRTQRGLGENVDDVGQIQDLLNTLTIQAHFGGQNNKIIKLLGNHDVIITSNTASSTSYIQQYTSPYATPAYNLFRNGLPAAEQDTYSTNYTDYIKFELANKLISGNTHVMCKIGKWFFVHGGMNTYVLTALEANCVPDPNIPKSEYVAHVNKLFHTLLKQQRTAADVTANATNKCLNYTATNKDTSPLINRNSGMTGDSYDPYKVWSTIDVCGVTEPALGELLSNIGGPGNHLAVAHCVQNQNDYSNSVGQIYEFRRTPSLTASDADRLVLPSPGIPTQAGEYMFGINYVCPDTPDSKEGGKIWRLDCGMSRAFLADKARHPTFSADARSCYTYSRSCRPQCLMIQNDHFNPGSYVTYVLLGKEALDIDVGLAKYGRMANKQVLNHDDNYEYNIQQVDDPIFGIPLPAPLPPAAPVQATAAPAQAKQRHVSGSSMRKSRKMKDAIADAAAPVAVAPAPVPKQSSHRKKGKSRKAKKP